MEEHHQLFVVKVFLIEGFAMEDTLTHAVKLSFKAQKRTFQIAVFRHHMDNIRLQGTSTHTLSD